MNLSQLVQSGPINRPQRVVLYGPEGTRKTWLGTETPRPLLLDLECGSHQYDCERITIPSYADLTKALDLLLQEKHDYLTIVVDTVDWLEKFLSNDVCRVNKFESIESAGYGKGWQFLREAFDKLLFNSIDGLIRRGCNVLILGHALVKRVQLPGLTEAFDKYELKLDRRNGDTLTEWADSVVFVNWDLRTPKNREGLVRAVGGKEPLLYPNHSVGWDAKNRSRLEDGLKCEFASIAPLFGIPAGSVLSECAVTVPETAFAAEPVPAPSAAPAATTPEHTPPAPTKDAPSPQPDAPATREHYDGIVSDLTIQEIRAADALLSALPQDRLLTFLRHVEQIAADGDYQELTPAYIRRILGNPEGFRNAVLGS
jgi:hypothetical protein